MAGNVFVPDVESYTRWAVLSLGKTNETTGYWSHAVQVRDLKYLHICFDFLEAYVTITVMVLCKN